MKFPDFVKTEKQTIIFRLLSIFADQYNKSMYWIKSQLSLYSRRFARIPNDFLYIAFLDYATYKLPQFLPPLPDVFEYCSLRDDFDARWLSMELGSKYCRQCRTSPDGLSGGTREVFYYGFIPSLGRVGERSFVAKCDCEAGQRRSAVVYTELVASLKRIGGNDCEATFSYYDEDSARIVTAREQSGYIWKLRLESGHYIEKDGEIVPNWSNPIYRTALGRAMAELYGYELPAELEPKLESELASKQFNHIGDVINETKIV